MMTVKELIDTLEEMKFNGEIDDDSLIYTENGDVVISIDVGEYGEGEVILYNF